MTTDASAVTHALPGPFDDFLVKLADIYRDIHANPELSMQEHRTSGIAAGWLLLAGNIPFVLRGDLYALAALAGGAIVSIEMIMGVHPLYPMLLGAAVCIFLRLMAIYYGWRAPVARWSGDKAK